MPSSTPDISVVIPTRNRAGFLRQAVTSALSQTGPAVEVIVVDDASDEPLPTFGDPRLLVHRRDRRGGQARARNDGLARARGQFVAFLDDDDLWAPFRLQAQLEALGDADFGYCAVVLVDAERRALGVFGAPRPETLRTGLRGGCVIPGPSSVVVRTELLRELGGFREDLPPLEDWDLWIRLAAAGQASATGELLVGYTVHADNAHVRDPRRVIRQFDLFTRTHGLGDGAAFFGWLAEENRRAGRRLQAAEISLRSAWRHRDVAALGSALSTLVQRPVPPEVRAPRRLGPPWLDAYREGA